MKGIKILPETKKGGTVSIVGSFKDLSDTKKFLLENQNFNGITGVIFDDEADFFMEITCDESAYEGMISLLNDFIAK
jgi:hypothetical protein